MGNDYWIESRMPKGGFAHRALLAWPVPLNPEDVRAATKWKRRDGKRYRTIDAARRAMIARVGNYPAARYRIVHRTLGPVEYDPRLSVEEILA